MPAIIKQLKPPHMRRWTDDSKGLKRAATQTSAYAEMDPYPVTGDPLKKANLRICGDGPGPMKSGRTKRSKPPHMRRWTYIALRQKGISAQTSAYAEMDPPGERGLEYITANLRICGDGPIPSHISSGLKCKPPHMRRWTYRQANQGPFYGQTSAYAEMDRSSSKRSRM